MIENVQAHKIDSSIWALALYPDNSGFITGGSDKVVHFWLFETKEDKSEQRYKLI
jgi:U3 small nucleolar RNA-associated protein 12